MWLKGKYSREDKLIIYHLKDIHSFFFFFSQHFLLTLLWDVSKIWQFNLSLYFNLSQASTIFLLDYWNSLLNAFLDSLAPLQPGLHGVAWMIHRKYKSVDVRLLLKTLWNLLVVKAGICLGFIRPFPIEPMSGFFSSINPYCSFCSTMMDLLPFSNTPVIL